jgi:hypothetical protein
LSRFGGGIYDGRPVIEKVPIPVVHEISPAIEILHGVMVLRINTPFKVAVSTPCELDAPVFVTFTEVFV